MNDARRVAALCGNTPAFIDARDAATIDGDVFVPINPRLAAREIAQIVRHARPDVVLVEPALEALWRRAADDVDGCPPWTTSWPAPARRPGRGEIGATLLFTSGTTGKPKACLRTAEQERARAEELIATYDITARDVHLIACPLAHSGPGIFLRAARSVGAETVVLPRFDPADFLAAVERHRATLFFLVPTQYERLMALPDEVRARYDTSSIRVAIVAGAPTAPATKRKLVAWLGEGVLWEFYGSSETGTMCVLRPEEQLSHPSSVGRPPPGVELRVLDQAGREVAAGEVGEIFVRSPAVMTGYLDDDDGRCEGFLSVGDLGRRDEDGYLYLVGRRSDMIITGGVNVYPAEVERALVEHPSVAAAVVFGVRDADWGEIVAAAIAPAGGESVDLAAVRASLRDKVAGYKIPKAMAALPIEELPIGASGKPLRQRAAALLADKLTRLG